MSAPSQKPKGFHFEFSTVPGFFKQSDDKTDDRNFDFVKEHFGLIGKSHKVNSDEGEAQGPWQRFEQQIRSLDRESGKGEHVKVLFLGRHGQGWHNVAEAKYGTAAWDCYWSMLDGADGITWSDAHLTTVGQNQAQDVQELWKQLLPQGIPPPEAYYVSPLTRTIETANTSFSGLALPMDRPYKPLIKEWLREALGVHTCDRRSTASHIVSAFPNIQLENGFSEPDSLWEKDYREPRSARAYRLARLLDDIFEHDKGIFLSLTSHSGSIASILEVVGHRAFALETGGVIPVVVRGKKVLGNRVQPPREPSEAPPRCDEPPQAPSTTT